MKKKFECENGCKHRYVEIVVLGCTRCIKKVSYRIRPKMVKEIEELFTKYGYNLND